MIVWTRRRTGAVALAVLVVGAAAVWMQIPAEAGIDPNDPAQVATGQAIYAQHCASCHGVDLEGEPDWREAKPDGKLPAPPHGITGHTWHHPQDMLFDITKHGIAAMAPAGYPTDMPAFDGILTDEQIRAVLAFIASTWPEDIQERWMAASRPSPE
ncbi:c-type cytochrome [Geminicoccus roseus]|uniref:c-type cytochrome n=1 Tax=Geminicoccus roseus TaxID=404900 RepID=UPI0005526F9C|nr:cytochrome c [Geminicoccus roseus]